MNTLLALGPEGTNGHEAAVQAIKRLSEMLHECRLRLMPSHASIFQEVCKERCYAVVPIENSSEGLVADNIRGFWLQQTKQPSVSVVGEIHLPVAHCLLAQQGTCLEEIDTVYSHPQALGQCRATLAQYGLAKTVPTASTAAAAAFVANSMDKYHRANAALASRFACSEYGLKILADHMEDNFMNTTRFHILGPIAEKSTRKGRTALLCWTENTPGAVCKLVTPIAHENVNLSSMHSLPLGIRGTYAFYFEFDEHVYSTKGRRIMAKLRNAAKRILVLGSYPQEEMK